jgi:hypothetical protein
MDRRWFVMIFLSVFFLESQAQFPNIKIDEAASDKIVREPSIAINPRNPLNVVAASTKDNIYVTIDGGKTWSAQKLASTFGVYGAPVVVADAKGTFYLFHLSDPTGEGAENEKSMDAIVCQVSFDGGKTWDGGNAVGFNPPKDQYKPSASVDGKGNVHVTWTQFDKFASADSTCQSVIMLSSSSNGKKWTKPVQISNNPGDCNNDNNTVRGTAPGMSDDKKFYVAWSSRNKLYLDRSFDGGSMWLSNDIVIGDHPGGWSMEISGHDRCNGLPVLIVDRSKAQSKGLLYLVWADQRNGQDNTDIWFMRSNNFGDYWSTPMKIGGDGNQKHQYMPRMTIDNATGFLYVLYYDRSNYDDDQTDVYLAYSRDAGSSFKTAKVSEAPFVPDASSVFGDHLSITAHKGIIMPIWTRMEEGKTSVWTAVIKDDQLPR